MADGQRIEISTDLLEELRRRAREQNRSVGDLIDEAVRSYLNRPGGLRELFERADRWQRDQRVEPLLRDLLIPATHKSYSYLFLLSLLVISLAVIGIATLYPR